MNARTRAIVGLLLGATCVLAAARSLHPDFALVDAQSVNVLRSGQPSSTMKTCGQCHDTSFIASHSSHERLDPSTTDLLMFNAERAVGGGPAGTMEMNCFLCHLQQPDLAARKAAIRAGRFAEASTATLSGRGVVAADAKGWKWNRAAFTAEGLVSSRHLSIQDPGNANCAACHGEVHPAGNEPVLVRACDLDSPQTATTGQVVAAQRINASGLNLAGKAALGRPWDIHAERQLQCTDCHHAPNNPAHANRLAGAKPAHLRYDPRALDIDDYLQRPDHGLARGPSAQVHGAAGNQGTMRRCENCHDASASHRSWLPYVETHMATLACESCHIPKMYAPAIQSYDWTVVNADATPVRSCRGVEGAPDDVRSLVTGFEPVLLKRTSVDGASLLAPYNLVTTFYWVHEDAGGRTRPVRLEDLKAAFLDGRGYAADIVAAFDSDHDGTIAAKELRIDSPAKEAAVRGRLERLGLRKLRMEGQVQPFRINHDVARGEHALNDCRACHAAASRLARAMPLADFAPVAPAFAVNNNVVATGAVTRRDDGAWVYNPMPERDGLYVFGASRPAWVDGIGALAFIGTLLGVMGHGGLRYVAARKLPHGHGPTHRVQMYDAYRRFWHWLQAITIVLLLLTGLVIHRPDTFAAVPFPAMVSLHNVLAALLVLNAALSLFYHLATERMREYIPRPYGFFDDAIRQARFYLSGIFRGEPHPFEKRPEARMNPIQKLTYFGILHVLLPLQILTGALMWGMQRWSGAAAALGGLPWLAPLHTLVAWLFATFILGHVYLATTGTTPLEAIRGMVTGYEEVEDPGRDARATE